eukprot:CAMPEP_0179312902 /NCGR_PEP_ID=MMETSP0797-20121207/53523_1 /TAXON_ID=47934 /ORGANISM="Dinophysis acuminata, Strain DAEP01" /LENGTH=75 /DNA_ID=CAMNT_0021022885 /DNA_START=66 /DNA_END=289 /DNA_ORIENTATION=+
MPSGVLKRWNEDRGFGFIQPNDGGQDLFCHVRDIRDGEGSVREGDKVRYDEDYDERANKPRASNVVGEDGGGGGG